MMEHADWSCVIFFFRPAGIQLTHFSYQHSAISTQKHTLERLELSNFD
jgi:hypothetical protein